MGKEPMNIMKLKRQNDQFAAAESHAKNLRIAHCEAQWFHSDFCKPPGKGSVPNIKDLAVNPTSIIETYKVKAVDKMAQELEAANDVLKLQRKEQLRELFKQERVQQEAELNSMGLAFHKLVD